MKSTRVFLSILSKSAVCLLALAGGVDVSTAQVFTVQVGSAPPPPVVLVNHSNVWRYRYGTSAPQVGWQTNADAALDASWLTGPGGFGYSTDTLGETQQCQTVLTTMFNGFTTLYTRQSFQVTEAVDPDRRLQLVIDRDDGFVAWLDGVEIGRSSNVTNAPGSEPAYYATTASGQNHEALGYRGLPLETNDLGLVGSRLQPGTHVLAVLGLNGAANSSDFILIPDLQVTGGQGAATEGAFLTLVQSNVVTLAGSNTMPGSVRVTINGVDARYDSATHIWSSTQTLAPGFNRLFVAALDGAGAILASQTKDVVCETATRQISGTLPGNTTWTAAGGIVRVTNELVVPAGVTLTIQPGTVVLLSPNASLRATSDGVISAEGSEANPVYFLPADGTTQWREVSARGAGAAATLRHIELVAGQVIAHPGATVAVEDSLLRDFRSSRLFLTATNAQQFAVRRCHLARYDQVRFSGTPIRIEDCLFEDIGSDATDLADHSDIVVRRTTYRFGAGSNTDALDLGNNPGMLIEQCLIHDFPDKGVSVAAQSHGTTVRGSLFYNTGIGIACYSASNCVFSQNTIADCTAGFSLYVRAGFVGPGLASGTNNIVWGCVTNVHESSGAAIDLAYSDVGGSVRPGAGNISADPLFMSPAARDYRLSAGSPAAGQGLGGVDMGVLFPVGGIPPAPFNAAANSANGAPVQVWWDEDADNESGFEVERSADNLNWAPLATVGPNVTNCADSSAALDQLYFYRVRATNSSGRSRYSNVAGAVRRTPQTVLCGVLTDNLILSPASGLVIVCNNLTVPTNITLTLLPGTQVLVTNGASLRAVQGGTIEIAGTAEAKVHLSPLNASNIWGEVSAQFAGSSLTIRHADIAGGQTTVYSNAVLVLEDSYLHDYRTGSNQALLYTHYARSNTVRRCHFRNYYETLLRNGVHLVEDCLFESMDGDALDFDAAQPGTVLRRCTFRHGNLGNVDAIDVGNGDLGGSHDVMIEDCLMYDFPFDKGVSIGDASSTSGITVRNCLIYGCRSGIQVKDDCFASVYQCTLVSNAWGFTNYNKVNHSSPTGGGHTTNTYNNILWDNGITISMWNHGTLSADHCDFGATNWPNPAVIDIAGVSSNNINVDPLFLNAAQRDYRLATNSPCRGAGRDGADMGARFPVGSIMAPSHPVIESIRREPASAADAASDAIRFWADSERSYTLQDAGQVSGGVWSKVADVFPQTLPRLVTITNTPGSRQRFYRLVSPAQP